MNEQIYKQTNSLHLYILLLFHTVTKTNGSAHIVDHPPSQNGQDQLTSVSLQISTHISQYNPNNHKQIHPGHHQTTCLRHMRDIDMS